MLSVLSLAQTLRLPNTPVCSNLLSELQVGLMFTQEMPRSQQKEPRALYLLAKGQRTAGVRPPPWESLVPRAICSSVAGSFSFQVCKFSTFPTLSMDLDNNFKGIFRRTACR